MLVSFFFLWRRDSDGERIVLASIVYLPHPPTLSGSLPSHVLLSVLESPHRPLSQLLLGNDHNSVPKLHPGNTDITGISDVFLFVLSVTPCAEEGSVKSSNLSELPKERMNARICCNISFELECIGIKIIAFHMINMINH